MLIWRSLARICLLMGILTFLALLPVQSSPSFAEDAEPASVEEGAATDAAGKVDEDTSGTSNGEQSRERRAPRFRSVGILPVENETRVMRGGELVTRALLGRLERRFGDVKSVRIDPEEDESYPGGPILLTEAKRLGEKHHVDALIDGSLIGYEITGGAWPSRAILYPEARVIMRLRVIRASDGTIFKYYTFKPKKPKIYPPSIRTERELFGRAIRDAIDELAEQMEKDGLFWQPKEKE